MGGPFIPPQNYSGAIEIRTCFRAADVLDDRLDGLARRILGAQLMGEQTVENGAGRLAQT